MSKAPSRRIRSNRWSHAICHYHPTSYCLSDSLGLNHISARVDDVEASVAQLGAAGFKVMNGFPRQGAHGIVAFFEPDPTTGLLFEVCAPDAGDDP